MNTFEDLNPRATAALYFLDSGQCLFKNRESRGGISSKFLTINDVSSAFRKATDDSGWLLPGIIRHGRSKHGPWYVYHQAPRMVTIQIISEEERLTIPTPATLLIAGRKGFYLFALKGNPGSIQTLYQAPFPNVYQTGKICFGTNATPKIDLRQADTVWKLFFESPFNQDLSNDKSTHHKSVIDLLKKLDLTYARVFPENELVPAQQGVESLVSRF